MMNTFRKAIYPGTFDPLTNGHLDVIQRGLRLFDSIVVAIGTNPSKTPLFTLEERVAMIKEAVGNDLYVEVATFDGLLVDFAKKHSACAILRGLRAVSDFDYELQRAIMNRKLSREVETVFLMTGFRWIFISSTIIKEAARFGGDLRDLVPECVATRLQVKFGHKSKEAS